MGNSNADKKRTENFFCQLKLIPFITETKEPEERNIKSAAAIISKELKGEEISQFYNEVISTPSSADVETSFSSANQQRVQRKCLTAFQENSVLKNSIFYHAQNGNLKGVEDCIYGGCPADQQDMFGWTPLMCAAFEGYTSIVQFLIKSGANLHLKNTYGMTAFDIAMQRKYAFMVKVLQEGVLPAFVNEGQRDNEVSSKFCSVCKLSYKETTALHERSIAHIFSSGKKCHSTYYHIPENNKGFQIMLKSGWDKNKGLGAKSDGKKFPVKTVLKRDRMCIGGAKEVPKVTHFGINDKRSIQKNYRPPLKLVRERTLKKWEKEQQIQKQRQKEINFRLEFN